MGWIICPNGKSVKNERVTGHVLYEELVNGIKSDYRTNEYLIRCIATISEIGLFGRKKEIILHVQKMVAETESKELAEACRALLTKHRHRKKREVEKFVPAIC